MAKLLVKWIITAAAVYFAAWAVEGIYVPDFGTAMWVSVVLGLLNAFVKPFLLLISVPLLVLSLGLFLVVVNAVVLYFAADLIDAFYIKSFWSAIWGSLIISAVSYLTDPPRQNPGQGQNYR